MAERVNFEGQEVEVQAAFEALSARLNQLSITLNETVNRDLNRTDTNLVDVELVTPPEQNVKPNFDLVSSIPTFDGEQSDQIHSFLDTVDGISHLCGWSEFQKTQIIRLKLTGSALLFFKSDDRCRNAKSAAEIRAALVERFGDSLPSRYYYEQLASIQQNKGESIEKYADRVMNISRKTIRVTASDEANKILREEADRRAMESFLRGLLGEIGKQTRIKFPTSFKEAVTTAIAISNLDRKPFQNEQEPSRKVFSTITQKNCYNCGKIGHIARHCRKRVVHTDTQQVGIRVCNFCKKKGHLETECRMKQYSADKICNNCNKRGHLAHNCWGSGKKINDNRKDQEKLLNDNGELKTAVGNPKH